MAAKGDNTPHDTAELTLKTLQAYRLDAPSGAPIPGFINHEADARNIAHFLAEHLPAATLTSLRKHLQ